jgi:hypothetical protein
VTESVPISGLDVEPAVRMLLKGHSLGEMPLRYVMLVEGLTDIEYLIAAVNIVQAEYSCNLLDLGDGAQIAVCTPRKPGTLRGGTLELEQVAKELMPFVIGLEKVGPICFVLDHDPEGRRVAKIIRELGYCVSRAMTITLDPKEHPRACRPLKGEPPICVEDLLSPGVQKGFFESRPAWCEVSFSEGVPVRYAWHGESKGALPGFVAANGGLHDVAEVARLIVRVRRLWNLAIPESVEAWLASGDARIS